MNPVKKIYCRIFQNVFKFALPFLPYRNPKIIGSLKAVPDMLKKKKCENVLIITDAGIHQLGLTDRLEKALTDSGISYILYDKTVANPTTDNVAEALELYHANNCKAIIGFGGGSRSTASSANAPRRGGDVNSNVTIDFMEACKGVKKKMRITHMVKCDQCNGTGADANTTTSTCTECHGRGSVQVNQRTPFGTVSSTRVCSRCGGKGKIVTNPCSKCRGSGRCRTTSDIELKIPAGIDNGQVLRVGGQGDAGLNGGPSGDLNVSVNVRPHDLFTRRGVDIYCEIPITYAQAVLGDKVTVPTIKGKVEYDIPEGTQSGTKFRLRGEGVKYLGRESYGDQYVTVVVEVPRKLTRQQKELLQKFDDSLEEKNQAKRQSFFEKLKRRFEQQ